MPFAVQSYPHTLSCHHPLVCSASCTCVQPAACTYTPHACRTCACGAICATTFAAAFITAWQLPSLAVLLQEGPPPGTTSLLLGPRRTSDNGSGRCSSGSSWLSAATAACLTCRGKQTCSIVHQKQQHALKHEVQGIRTGFGEVQDSRVKAGDCRKARARLPGPWTYDMCRVAG
jgi:hypothetical protein